jgi:hypothetical protein
MGEWINLLVVGMSLILSTQDEGCCVRYTFSDILAHGMIFGLTKT